MCIIVVKPSGKRLPSKQILSKCFSSNPHGAGFMYNNPQNEYNSDTITIAKGFMDFESFYYAITSITADNFYNSDLVIHFRYATQGSINSKNCHPFPVSKKIKDLQAISCITTTGIAHNGVISFCSIPNKHDLSDTQIFIKDILSQVPQDQLKDNYPYEKTYSKFTILDKDGFSLIGDFIEDDGIFYSNTSYIPYEYTYTSRHYKPYIKRGTTHNKYAITAWEYNSNDSYIDEEQNYYYNDYTKEELENLWLHSK